MYIYVSNHSIKGLSLVSRVVIISDARIRLHGRYFRLDKHGPRNVFCVMDGGVATLKV